MDFSKCKDEQSFKMLYIKNVLKKEWNDVFCIETEETVKGFPDVLAVKCNNVVFFEFKISNNSGKIKFQPTQPSFYKAHKALDISVVALDRSSGKVHKFKADELFIDSSPYKMNEKAQVSLCNVKGDTK